MNRLYTVSAYLGVAVVLTCLVWASRLALRPVMPPRPAPKKVVVEVPQPKPKPEPSAGSVKLARVGLRRAGPPSAEALKAVDAGRFIVRTSFSDPAQKPEIYHQLCLRGGIYILQDDQDHYWWERTASKRLPLSDSGLDLATYALNRPRALPANDAQFTGCQEPRPGQQLYLVMPKIFEAQILTEIEHFLPHPLSDYQAADLSLAQTPGGYLDLTLNSVEDRHGALTRMSAQIRGL